MTHFTVSVDTEGLPAVGDPEGWGFAQLARFGRTFPERVTLEVSKPAPKAQVKQAPAKKAPAKSKEDK